MKKPGLIFLLFFAYVQLNAQMITNRDSLKQVIATTKEDTSKINALWNLGFSYAFVHQDSAILHAGEALALSIKTNNLFGEAHSHLVLCLALTLQGNYINALQHGFNSISIGEKLNDTSIIIFAYHALEICYREQEDYNEALKYVNKAEAISRLPAYNSLRPQILGDKCVIYERLNRLDSALFYGLQCYDLIKDWSGIYLKLGTVYSKLNKPDSALFYYRAGIPFAIKYLIYIDLVDIYNKMSELFQSTGPIDSAIYYGTKSIMQEGALSYSEGRIRATTHLANLYESIGQKDSTLKYYKLSLALNEKMFDRQKIREAQSFAFNQRIHQQELQAQQEKDKNRIKMFGLAGVAILFLVVAFILWRNNRQKQKAKAKIEAAYAELKNTQAQLIQSEKMASLGELTAGIAHEIQNPLNFVNNFSEVSVELLNELKGGPLRKLPEDEKKEAAGIVEDLTQNLDKISFHGKRADGIVKGMLQHSRQSSGSKEPTDINTLADEYLRLSYHGLRAKDKSFNATLKTDFDTSIGKIQIIPQDIGRVLLNLYNNAFYAVSEKSKQQTPGYEPVVSVSTKEIHKKVEVRVKDNGNGISEKVLDKIFQPFFTTKPTGQGTGLGLSLAYDIVKAHGGELKVETKQGEGSEFIIELPLA